MENGQVALFLNMLFMNAAMTRQLWFSTTLREIPFQNLCSCNMPGKSSGAYTCWKRDVFPA